MNNLKIYKASAGSGKTFTLAVQYISLLVREPHDYKHILAVTFTNKATNEMKTRIIDTLYKIANRDKSAEPYIKKIEETVGKEYDREDIRKKCETALKLILHDYSRFRIETIDSFFQSIIRDLAHELNLTANLRVDLNQQEVLADAVKLLIEDLSGKEKALLSAVQQFIEDKIEEGKNWEIAGEVEEFAKNIFSEKYLTSRNNLEKEIGDGNKFTKYKKKITTKKEILVQEIKNCAQKFFDFCNAHGCNDQDYFYRKGSGPYNHFRKLDNGDYSAPNSYVQECLNGHWWSKDSGIEQYAPQFTEMLQTAVDTAERNIKDINTCSLILRHLNKLRLLSVIDKKVRDLNDEANRFLLADTAHFLHEIIKDSDVPFIYEKSGTRFNHIMIDEFQDTSALQWENFKPLISNSIANNKYCLIVGDVKQSIYRWRNSDWTILNEIDNSEFRGETQQIPLETNHRSAGRIIEFNNEFFRKAVQNCSDEVKQAYAELHQFTREGNENRGYVKVEHLEEKGFNEAALARLAETIKELKEAGVKENDITLLLRTNREIVAINQYFAENHPEISIVSEFAFRLDSSKAIRIIIDAMRVISHPGNKLHLETLLCETGSREANMFVKDCKELIKMLPEEFAENLEKLYMTPLFELAETIYSIFNLKEIQDQDSYLFFFYDLLADYVRREHCDIDNFLRYWDETLCGQIIPSSKLDGVRAFTIHKSKGLEFHTVICPLCNWRFRNNGIHEELMWCKPKENPYNELSLSCVTYKKDAATSIFKDEYDEETMKNFVDNLNMMYVAFTRAEENLIVFTTNKVSEGNVTSIISKALGDNDYEVGEIVKSSETGVQSSETDQIHIHFRNEGAMVEFRQSNKADEFFDDDDDKKGNRNMYRNKGIIMHRIMELITSPDDFDRAIRIIVNEGLLTDDKDIKDVKQLFMHSFEDERIRSWFDPHWKVMNECTILQKTNNDTLTQRRPDRVIYDGKETIVIDYKTGRHNNEHYEQVKDYVRLLREMGYPEVKGYLWYMSLHEVIEIIG